MGLSSINKIITYKDNPEVRNGRMHVQNLLILMELLTRTAYLVVVLGEGIRFLHQGRVGSYTGVKKLT